MADADEVIAALHAGDEELAPIVAGLSDAQVAGPSAAAEWTVAQVLSHLGSGAEITRHTLAAARAGGPNPGWEANKEIWDVWDTRSAREMTDAYQPANTALLADLDATDPDTRRSLLVDLGFLPAPVSLAVAASFRLSEFALHSWDVRWALDHDAVVTPAAVPPLLEQIARMTGFLGRPDRLAGRSAEVLVELTDLDRTLGLGLGEQVTLGPPPAAPTATLTLPAEAWLRLLTGRLAADRTPAGVTVSGALDLDDLRAVFPGF